MVEEFAHVAGTGTGGGLVGHREIHSTCLALKSAPTAMSMRLTVQLPPMKSFCPQSSAVLMTGWLTGSRMMVALSAMRRLMQRRSSSHSNRWHGVGDGWISV